MFPGLIPRKRIFRFPVYDDCPVKEEPLPVTVSVTSQMQFSPIFLILDDNARKIGQGRTGLPKT